MCLRSRSAVVLMLTWLSLGSAMAEPFGYGEAFDELYRIDLANGHAQFLGVAGSFGFQRISKLEGLTYSPDGTLYAISDGLKTLLRIDQTSGSATVIGSVSPDADLSVSAPLDPALAFTCDGRLWLASATAGKLWQMNPTTGATTLVGTLDYQITGLVARGNELLGAGSRGDEGLYRIDTTTANATLIGRFGATVPYVDSVGLSFDAQGHLWAALDYIPPEPGTQAREWSDYAQIDPNTGAIQIRGQITGPNRLQYVGIKGLAVAPPICTAGTPAPVSLPSLSWLGLIFLSLLLVSGTALKLRRPIA